MNTPRLPMVGRRHSAYDLGWATYRGEIPGFQDYRGCGLPRHKFPGFMLDLMVELETVAQEATGAAVPFTDCVRPSNPENRGVHMDASLRSFALHANGSEDGIVELGHFVLPLGMGFDAPQLSRRLRLAEQADKVTNVHSGSLRSQGVTVFSEGNVQAFERRRSWILQPSAHNFVRDLDAPWFGYIRVAASAGDARLPDAEKVWAKREEAIRRLTSSDYYVARSQAVTRLRADPRASAKQEAKGLGKHPGLHLDYLASGQAQGFRAHRRDVAGWLEEYRAPRSSEYNL